MLLKCRIKFYKQSKPYFPKSNLNSLEDYKFNHSADVNLIKLEGWYCRRIDKMVRKMITKKKELISEKFLNNQKNNNKRSCH